MVQKQKTKTNKKTPELKPLGGKTQKTSGQTISKINFKTSNRPISSSTESEPTLSAGVVLRCHGMDRLVLGVFVFVLSLAFVGQYTDWYDFDLTILWQFWPLWLLFLLLSAYMHSRASVVTNTIMSLAFLGSVGIIWAGNVTPADFNIAIARTVSGKGELVVENRKLSGFDSIEFNGKGFVVINQGLREEVIVQAEDTVIKNIITAITDDSVLTIDFKKESLWERVVPKQIPKFYITVKELRNIELSGSGVIESGSINLQDLTLRLRGSGEFDMNMNVDTLVVDALGSGRLALSGIANSQIVNINGSVAYDGQRLVGKDGYISISGSGAAVVNILSSLNAEINGSGVITYFGEPDVTENINGSGEVVQYDLDLSVEL